MPTGFIFNDKTHNDLQALSKDLASLQVFIVYSHLGPK